MKIILKRINAKFANKLVQSTKKFSGKIGLAHHGLQRSGTNYLNECLWRCGNPPLNSFDEARHSPRHKHCRWYSEKASIPSFLIEQYGNNFHVNHLDELNKIANYPKNTSHLVIKKELYSWLASIINWGIKCNWFTDKNNAFDNLNQLILDYDNYYNFWQNLEDRYPQKVSVLSLEKFHDNFNLIIEKQMKLGIEIKNKDFNGKIDQVDMSPLDRKKIVSRDEVLKKIEINNT